MVATSLIDKLLSAPVSTQESLQDLNKFVSIFDESIVLLNSLKIPDLGSFILFSMAFRCLPISSRKLFESSLSVDFPKVDDLLMFIRSRILIIENVGDVRKPISQPKPFQLTGHTVKGKQAKSHPTAFVITKSSSATTESCLCCKGNHSLCSCPQFRSWNIDNRSSWTRDHRLCFVCFSDKHWSNQCKSKTRCTVCSRKHHALLHVSNVQKADNAVANIDASLCASISNTSLSVLLGTALVHVRDHSGSWQTVRVLVDSASQISAMTTSCSERLSLRPTRWNTPVSGLSGVPVFNVKGLVECSVQFFQPNLFYP